MGWHPAGTHWKAGSTPRSVTWEDSISRTGEALSPVCPGPASLCLDGHSAIRMSRWVPSWIMLGSRVPPPPPPCAPSAMDSPSAPISPATHWPLSPASPSMGDSVLRKVAQVTWFTSFLWLLIILRVPSHKALSPAPYSLIPGGWSGLAPWCCSMLPPQTPLSWSV